MTSRAQPDFSSEEHLNEILLAFVEAVEAGESPDPHKFLAAHPEFASDLAEFFEGREFIEQLAAAFRDTDEGDDESSSTSSIVLTRPPPTERSRRAPAAGTSTAASEPHLGELGDFRLMREIGRGGMGIVYEAQQLSLNRRVALKMLPFAAALDPKQLQRFKNEAQAAALLHHNSIVPVYAIGCERGVHYYAMQFIEGQSLAALLEQLRRSAGEQEPKGLSVLSGVDDTVDDVRLPDGQDSIPEAPPTVSPSTTAISLERSMRRIDYFRRVARLLARAAEALEHAHQQGVIHRDIKPANLLLDGRGDLWITDFGLALLQTSGGLTVTGELVGTLRYMSPEQAYGQRGLVDHRTDIYSLGVTLYELLTLQRLFESDDSHQLLQQIANEEPRLPRTLDGTIPVELETIVLKAIAKSPTDRYATSQDLADDLRRFLVDQPILARRPTLLDRTVKWCRRHRAIVVSAIVLLIAASAGLLVSTVLIAHAHREAKQAYERETIKAKEAQEKTVEVQEQRSRAEANFAQAREAVDFFVKVSEEELVDQPDIMEVRRRLLEGAVQYYQTFIDQYQGEPSFQAELAASKSRMTQILDELIAQRQYEQIVLRGTLLSEWDVQKDLGINQDQEDRIYGLTERLMQQRREEFRTIRRLPRDEQAKRFKEMSADNDKAIAEILTPDQAKRLGQIALQWRGPEAFSQPEVAEALDLTDAQQETVRAIQDRIRHEPPDERRGSGPGHRGDGGRRPRTGTPAEMLSILTPEQQAAWHALTGDPYVGRLPPRFGPPPDRENPRDGKRGRPGPWDRDGR